ncbi:MAG: oligosaccharide flippase family protein [Candidatus Marinimicrobia bacterium]|nr:oligosaccharide flippase family protein [Candidatus Neomarinimicrobiota bacterium]
MKKKSFLNDLSFTFLAQFLVTIIGIILLKILSKILPEEGLGAYLVIRRVVGLTFPLVTLNLGMSLSRYISFDFKKANSYLLSTFFIITILFFFLLIISQFCDKVLSEIFFGNASFSSLLIPMIVFLYVSSFQSVCINYFRGKHNFLYMNIINIVYWILSLIVLAFPCLYRDNYIVIIRRFFLLYAILDFIYLWATILFDKNFRYSFLNNLRKNFRNSYYKTEKEFFKYGIVRLPNGFFLSAIFTIPVIVASSKISLNTAAYIGIIITIVRMVQLLGDPFNLLFLPKFSYFKAKNNKKLIHSSSQMVLEYIFTFPIIIGVIIYFLSPEIVTLWFGDKYSVVIKYLQLLSPFTGLLIGYILIRGILDGLYAFPYTNIITFCGFLGTGLVSILTIKFNWDLLGLTLSVGIGIVFLGISSIYFLVRRQGLSMFNKKNICSIVWGFSIFILFNFYNRFFIIDSLCVSLILKSIVSIIISILSFLLYKKIKLEWISEVAVRINSAAKKF